MNEQVVFVGGKPFMNYVTAVVMQFTTSGANKVIIRSRGKFISRAVDVAEIVNSRFLTDSVEISNVEIGSEDFKNKEDRQIRVSTIDIHLNKTNSPNISKNVKELTEQVESPIEIVSHETKEKEPIVVTDINEKPQQKNE